MFYSQAGQDQWVLEKTNSKKNGYFLRNSIIWHFNNMQNCSNRLSGRWESILWFVKNIDNYIFNLDDIRVPYITKGDKRLSPEGGRNPTDVWYFNRVNNMTKKKLKIDHIPTMYPIPMIERIIKMSSKSSQSSFALKKQQYTVEIRK
jgi:adenine-specific DNA-methyltransferase